MVSIAHDRQKKLVAARAVLHKEEINMGNPAWVVMKVIPRKDYTFLLTFEGGKHGVYDFRPDLSRPIFRKQQNIDFFIQAKALYGTVVWPDDSDIAPEHLYEQSIPTNNA